MTLQAKLRVNKADFTLDVDIQIPSKGVTAIFGPSGCGKTTLLRAIAGLETCDSSYLKIGNEVWQDNTITVPTHQRSLGYVFQEASLLPHLTVRGNIEYGAKRAAVNTSPNNQTAIIDRAIELLDVGSLLERRPEKLSGGEQQRVAIARAIAVNPKILLMDEPLSALDVARKQEIIPYLETLHEALEIPILYVSHAPDEVARLADHLVLLDAGREVASGPIAHMLTRLDLPIAHSDAAGALIEAVVSEHDEQYDLTLLDFKGNQITVTRQPLALGKTVRLRIAARDVSLTLTPPEGTSILNIIAASVEEIVPEGSAQMMIRLTAGESPLLSRITRKSAALLNLEAGKKVYAQIKSVALLS